MRKKINTENIEDFLDDDINDIIDGEESDFDFLIPKFKERVQVDASGETTTLKTLESININHARLRRKLEKWGFFCQTIDKARFFFRLQDNIIEEVTDEQIRDYVDKIIRNMPDKLSNGITKEMVENKFLSGNENLLRKTIINRLQPQKEIVYLEDTVDKAYFFYQNTIVECSKAGIKTIDYKDNDKIVFKGSILKRDFTIQDKSEFQKGIYYQFLQNIADGHKTSTTGERQYNRFEEFKTVIGYLLHKFFARKLKLIWFLDSRGDAKAPKGRSGKGLIMKGCGNMLNADMLTDKIYVAIDGKELDQTKATKYEEAALNTKLICLDDVEHYFKPTGLFNAILEGWKIRQMYKSPFIIRAKAAVLSNHVPRTDSDSVRDRVLEVQTTDFYSGNFSPLEDFGKWIFSDEFTKDDWLHFDNTMLHCVQQFFIHGLKKPADINLGKRKLQETTNTDFVDFMIWYEKEKMVEVDKVHQVFKEDLKNEFVRQFPDHIKITSNKMTWWVRNYTMYRKDESGDLLYEPYDEENREKFDIVAKDGMNTAKRAFVFYKRKKENNENM